MMHWPRITIAGMVGLIAFIGLGLACLLNASSPWAWIAPAAYFAILAIAPLGIVYRRGPRRAFWIGSAAWGWICLAAISISGESDPARPDFPDELLLSGEAITSGEEIPGNGPTITRLLNLIYPLVIPDARQPSRLPRPRAVEHYITITAFLQEGLDPNRLPGEHVEIYSEDKDGLALLAPKALVTRAMGAGPDPNAAKPLARAELIVLLDAHRGNTLTVKSKDPNTHLVVVPYISPAFPSQVASLFSQLAATPPVDRASFDKVGRALVGLLACLVGGVIGRWFHATRDRDTTPAVG